MPSGPHGATTDFIAFPFGVTAILSALDYRRKTGEGQYIDLSQLECSLHFLAPEILDFSASGHIPEPQANIHPWAAPHDVFPCKDDDDSWIAIGVFSNEEWESLCRVMGDPAWAREPEFATILARKEREDKLRKLIAAWTLNYSRYELMVMLQEAGVCAGMVSKSSDLYEDPQLKHRNHFWTLDHPEMGKGIA